MRFMQTKSVLQTKNRSEPAKNRFSVALVKRTLHKILEEFEFRPDRSTDYGVSCP